MSANWWLAILVVGGVGGGVSAWLWTTKRRRDEAQAGLRALAGMRWREFSHFVLDAMRHRGYEVDADAEALERGQQTDFILERQGKRWLLACKHGSAYHIGPEAVAELMNAIRFNGAAGGLLVTTGKVGGEARSAAAKANVELLDGTPLWHEISPLLPQTLRDALQVDSFARAKRQIGMAWLGALVLGAGVGFLAGSVQDATPEPLQPVAATSAPVRAKAPARTPAPSPQAAVEIDPGQQEELHRLEVARTVSGLPGIDRALWSTRSTLLVYLEPNAPDRLTEICAVMERYDTLATSRLQLQPAPDSPNPVRFRQCRTF